MPPKDRTTKYTINLDAWEAHMLILGLSAIYDASSPEAKPDLSALADKLRRRVMCKSTCKEHGLNCDTQTTEDKW